MFKYPVLLLFFLSAFLTASYAQKIENSGYRRLDKLVEEQNYQSALNFVNNEIKKSPKPKLFHLKGQVYFLMNRLDSSMHYLNIASLETPSNAETWELLGKAFYINRKFERAEFAFSKARKLAPENHKLLFDIALTSYNLKEYESALKRLSEFIEHDNMNAEAYFYRGMVYLETDSNELALNDLNRAIELRPDYAAAYQNRGLTKEKMEDYIGSVNDYSTAIRLTPDYHIYYQRGREQGISENYTEALNDLNKAISINNTDPEAYYYRGSVKLQLKKYQDAIDDFSRAIENDSTYANAYFNRAICYGKLKNDRAAIDDFSRVITINPNDAEAYFNRGGAYFNRWEFEPACQDFEKALNLGYEEAGRYFPRYCVGSQKKKDE